MLSKIHNNLNTEYIGKKILYYDTVDSTNLTAKENLHEPDGTVFIANHQLKGRGRLSREWTSDASNGIYMSILLKPEIPIEQISQITLVAGLSVAAALNKISSNNVYIKWPNDCVICGKKICGILTELSLTESKACNVIVGIGINVNNKAFLDELKNIATSLFIENNHRFDISEIMILILSEFEKNYSRFLKNGFSSLVAEYSNLCITLGQEVQIITPTEKYNAKAIEINSEGKLLADKNGTTKIINSGEVSVRGILGYV